MAVVVSTRNRAFQLEQLLGAMVAQTVGAGGFELVVVDDGSTDRTATLLAEELDRDRLRLRLVRRPAPGGAAVGREQGWRATDAELIVFTDDDCVPDARWLEAGVAAAAESPGAIVQGRTDPRPDQLHRLGPFSRTIRVAGPDHAFQTTNIFYPRALLERIGGFDTRSYADVVGGEDTDLAWRAIESGAEARFAPEARVLHAVNVLGPLGLLRVAARPTASLPYARHPVIRRRHFAFGVFRKPTHLLAVLAGAGLLAARLLARPWRLPLAVVASLPYLQALRARGIIEGGGLALVPYFLLHDLVEILATFRGGLRGGRFLL